MEMKIAHGLVILNGLEKCPLSSRLTCFSHRHGASMVDYVMAHRNYIPHIQDLTVGPYPIGVFSINFTYNYNKSVQNLIDWFPTYEFCREIDGVYISEIYKLMSTEDPWKLLEEHFFHL